MSIITSLNKQATNLARKALRLGTISCTRSATIPAIHRITTTRTSILSPDWPYRAAAHRLNGDRDTRPPRSLTPKPDLLTTKTEAIRR